MSLLQCFQARDNIGTFNYLCKKLCECEEGYEDHQEFLRDLIPLKISTFPKILASGMEQVNVRYFKKALTIVG